MLTQVAQQPNSFLPALQAAPEHVSARGRCRLQFRLALPQRVFEQYFGPDGLPRRLEHEHERARGERFRNFAELLRSTKTSVCLVRRDGSEAYVSPRVSCTAAAIIVYLAVLERGSCLAWLEWTRLADLRGVEYNSAYKQVGAFARLLDESGTTTQPFEYPRGNRGAVRFMLTSFDVEFSNH